MNIYDFFMQSTDEISVEIKKAFNGVYNIPEDKNDFMQKLNITSDDRVHISLSYDKDSEYMWLTLYIDEVISPKLEKISIRNVIIIDELLNVYLNDIGNGNSNISLYKKEKPLHQYKDRIYKFEYALNVNEILKNVKQKHNLKTYLDSIHKYIIDLGEIFEDVTEIFCSGEYNKSFNRYHSIKFDEKHNIISTPDFTMIVNAIYNIEQKYGYRVSIDSIQGMARYWGEYYGDDDQDFKIIDDIFKKIPFKTKLSKDKFINFVDNINKQYLVDDKKPIWENTRLAILEEIDCSYNDIAFKYNVPREVIDDVLNGTIFPHEEIKDRYQ